MARQIAEGSALYLVVHRTDDDLIVGECNFSNIIRGPFQACYLGFSVDQQEEGRGLMYWALQASIDHVFRELGLHRIMANYCPENLRSAALLARLGFAREGLAQAYLKINGAWRDHVLTAKINEAA
jgi:ribosomal-protein-alanine N-acetyltransferase